MDKMLTVKRKLSNICTHLHFLLYFNVHCFDIFFITPQGLFCNRHNPITLSVNNGSPFLKNSLESRELNAEDGCRAELLGDA